MESTFSNFTGQAAYQTAVEWRRYFPWWSFQVLVGVVNTRSLRMLPYASVQLRSRDSIAPGGIRAVSGELSNRFAHFVVYPIKSPQLLREFRHRLGWLA